MLCSFSTIMFAQNAYEEIDSLLDASTLEYDKYENQKSIELAEMALRKAQKLKISQAIAEANYNIARAHGDMGEQEKSFHYLEKAKKESFADKNDLFRAKLAEVAATNYMSLSMYPQAVKEFHKALNLSRAAGGNPLAKKITGRTYGNLYVTYHGMGNLDSAYFYLNKEIDLLKKSEEEEVYSSLSLSYLDFGLMFLEEKHDLDSARYYFQKSLCLLDKYEDPFKQDIFRALGDLYFEKKEYEKSLNYYLETRKILDELDFFDPSYTYILLRISNIYRHQNKTELAQLYSDKYIELKDSLSASKIDAMGNVVNNLLKEQEKVRQESKKRSYLIVGSVFSVSILVLLMAGYFYRKKQLKEKRAIWNSKELLLKKEHENRMLKLQLNTAFEEIVELAKSNSPEFLSRFQEVYPAFYYNLMTSHPGLQTSEIKFCAMLFLNFSSKDIAEFTYVTVKAVQNRKNRLRKKLNISSEEDLNLWMQKLNN